VSVLDLRDGGGLPGIPTPADAAPAAGRDRWERTRRWLPGAVGVLVLLVVWQVVGLTIFSETKTVPAPTAIWSEARADGWDFYWANISTTLEEAARGWVWGNALAILTAIVFVQIPFVERALMQVAVASYCVPIIVLASILNLQFEGSTPKVILAAVSVFFTTLVGMLVGLKSADRTSLDLVRAYGGGSWAQLWKVRLRASLPSLFAGLRIAAPAAMLGAIIGEWLGAENGLGVAMVAAQSTLKIERTWGLALAATAVSGIAYAATAVIGNLLTPWAARVKR
jgi:ABC-type nitrate/sulfonate/bicarbonate transport system permease component